MCIRDRVSTQSTWDTTINKTSKPQTHRDTPHIHTHTHVKQKMEPATKPDQDTIAKQIEYYLSDDNLKRDEFFHEAITKNPDGYLNLELIMNCNKIKNLGVSRDDIVSAIKTSGKVEVDEKLTGIRRKNNYPLPELEKRGRKKQKIEGKEDVPNLAGEGGEVVDSVVDDDIDPLILAYKTENERAIDTNWKDIQATLEKKFSIEIPYLRFNKTEGHVAVDKKKVEKSKVDEIVKEPLEINGEKIHIYVAQDAELKAFWDNHGRHFQGCIVKNKEGNGRSNSDRKGRHKRDQVSLGGQHFDNVPGVRTYFKNLINKTPNGESVRQKDHDLLAAILKYHDHGDKKLANLKSFTVDVHPEHPTSRCFFAVKEDGSKEDFSLQKCLDAFDQKHKSNHQQQQQQRTKSNISHHHDQQIPLRKQILHVFYSYSNSFVDDLSSSSSNQVKVLILFVVHKNHIRSKFPCSP
eukprot:TRINITY_DN11732_c0_g2_i7.p1 TRINITY_DN11732_c0_g2~~TRINITY_DN11732_c0_g2_i7.p1  ORF type:complete len:463 (-),score=172.26 TRINITY_DN11732_c0_g2_i7:111-1499(-)